MFNIEKKDKHKTKSIKRIFLADLLTKLHVLIIELANQLFFTEEKMQLINLLKQLLKKMNNSKKWNEKSFKSSNKCWICNKLFGLGDNNVRDHDHVTGK